MKRLVVLPPAHDGVGQEARAGEASGDRQLDGVADEDLGWLATVAVLAHELRVRQRHHHRRGRPPLEHLARLDADAHERVHTFALDLGRQDLDWDARDVGGQRLADGNASRVLRHQALLDDRLGFRCAAGAAQAERQHRQRELGVVARQPLRLLAQQAASQPLIFLLEVQDQLPVLVALRGQLRVLGHDLGELRLDPSQPIIEADRVAHAFDK